MKQPSSRSSGFRPHPSPIILALVGDAADGYPGLAGWGAKSSAAVLSKFAHIENIPADAADWHVNVMNAGSLAHTLRTQQVAALLFRTLATLRTDIELFSDVDQLRWTGPTADFPALAARLDSAITEKQPRTKKRKSEDQSS